MRIKTVLTERSYSKKVEKGLSFSSICLRQIEDGKNEEKRERSMFVTFLSSTLVKRKD